MKTRFSKLGMGCDCLAALRCERQKAVDGVAGIGMKGATNAESQAIYAHLTLAHKAEVQQMLECPDCRQTLNFQVT
jgi:hypothetical protein